MIHQFKLNGHNIVIDVYSGSVHVVDDVAYDIIRLFLDHTREEIVAEILAKYSVPGNGAAQESKSSEDGAENSDAAGGSGAFGSTVEPVTEADVLETLDDIEELKAQGKLFSEDEFAPNAGVLKNRHTEIKALCLHVAHTCDLTCSYCFAGQGRFHGPSALMSSEVARRAIDFLIENSGNRHNLEVDFFGGEPLLNFDVVKDTVAYARSIEKEAGKNFRFTLTTNGMGITDEVIDFANRECHNVVLSLDGRKEIHDRERKTAAGKGSYDVIVPKFQKLVAAREKNEDPERRSYYMRGTFTHYNPDFLEDIRHMLDLGFTELSMEPVVTEPGSRFALTEEDIPIVMEQYEELAKLMLERERDGRPFTFYHYMLDLTGGPCIYKRISGCGSGTEYYAVTPSGDLYPCHQFVGDRAFLMGNIWDGITRGDTRDKFKLCNVYARPDCADCWAKLYCSGGCAANAYHATGDILGTYGLGCELFKKRIECALMMQIERQERAEAEAAGEGN